MVGSDTNVIGIDIGTTSTKAIVMSTNAQILGLASQGYPLLVSQLGWAEQDPEAILSAVVTSVRMAVQQAAIPPGRIAAIGFSAAMHSLIAIDRHGQPLTNSMVWTDTRSLVQAERLKQDQGGLPLYQRVGTPIHPMLPLTKLIWLRETEPERFAQASKFISIKEYILYKLLHQFVVDEAIASATGLFNLHHRQWDRDAIALAGIRLDQLSDPVLPTTQLQGLSPDYATAMGIAPHTPVVVGASDGALANVGVGAIAPDQLAITIGTSSALRTLVPSPLLDPQGRTFCYAFTADRWMVGGASNSGGVVWSWLRDQLCQPEVLLAHQHGQDPYEVMMAIAEDVPIGAEGLRCLPYLSGERAPYWNAAARGAFVGLALHHQRSHLMRAVLEGILFSIHSIYRIIQELNGTGRDIRASGGFARSPIWLQMMADALGATVVVPEAYEASAVGAAIVAMLATGAIAHLEEVQSFVKIGDHYFPHPDRFQVYQQVFAQCDRLYQQLEQGERG